jgi:TonB-linked SusC/RagA family outer membrane protein
MQQFASWIITADEIFLRLKNATRDAGKQVTIEIADISNTKLSGIIFGESLDIPVFCKTLANVEFTLVIVNRPTNENRLLILLFFEIAHQTVTTTMSKLLSIHLRMRCARPWHALGSSAFFLFLLLFSSFAVQAQRRVTGTVTNDSLAPLAGVSVVVKGSSTGTSTDADGKFSISVPANATLQASFVGYASMESSVGNKTTVDFRLKSATNEMDQVIVVGFGTQKKVNLTGAVSTVNAKALADRPVQNASQALQGLVTGLNISQNNGSLESTPGINIRGTGTIGTSSSSPLVLIDGMEGSINALNPQDIETVSVLKDAAAASIYGSRAAFGVILVTTKRGKAGKATFNYNNNLRSTRPTLLPKQMDSYTFALFFNDASVNGGSAPFFDAAALQRIQDYQSGKLTTPIPKDPNNPNRWADGYAYGNANTDWYRAMYKKQAFQQEHNFSLTAGNERTSFYLSGDYMNQEGMMVFNPDNYNRIAVTAKINSKLTDQLSVNYTNRFIHEGYHRPSALTNGFYQDLGRQGWPTLPLYDPNGYLFSSPSPALAMRDGGTDNNQKDWNYQQLQLVFEPIKGWKTYGEFNYRSRNDFRHWDVQRTFNHDVNGNPYVYGTNSEVQEYGYKENYFNTNIYTDYSKSIAERHNFKLTAGFQTELTKYRDLSVTRQGVIVPSVSTIATTSGVDGQGRVVAPAVSGQYQNWGTQGFFSRLNYDYDGKYLLEGNLRYDGSSRFRSDTRWGLFPSVSAGWNVAKEAFFDRFSDVLSTFKLRASYGQLGNQNTNVWYPTYVTMPIGTANGTWLVNGAQPNTASAPGLVSSTLTWETIQSYNVGLDIAALNNRLTASLDLFKRKTLDMVGPAPELPVTLGTGVPQTNNTDLETAGFEVELSWNDKIGKDFSYNLRFLLSDNQTTVTRYPNKTGSFTTFREGQKTGEIWGYTTVGVAKSKAEMDAHLAKLSNGQNFFGSQWDAGDVMYLDYNGDGKIDNGGNTESNAGDFHKIGNSTPRYTFGFDASANFKGFDFRAFFQGVAKRDYWQGSYFFWGATNPIWWSTGFIQHEDYFRGSETHPLGQNLDAYYPRPSFNSGKNQQVQTRYLQDASYIRLKNIQLGYTLPASLVRGARIQRLRVYLSGENIWTGTKTAKMFDPETIDGGSGGSVYPLSKVISGGLTVTF